MRIIVNDIPLELHNGAKVKDAILKYYSQSGKIKPAAFPAVEDRYGNEVETDGELTEGDVLIIKNRQGNGRAITLLAPVIIMASLFSGCSTGKKAVSASQGEKQAVIFAVNDMHAAIDNFPKLAYIVDSLRALYPDMLLVSAGDNQTGNPVNDQYPEKGLPEIELMNATGFNLSAVGNHEFDSHQEGFRYLTQKAKFDFICANAIPDKALHINLKPYKIFTLPNGLKIAFLGLLQINQNGIPDSHPDNTKGFRFSSAFDVAPQYMFLKKKCNVFIALSHIGFESDIKLAETLPAGIDLIIGGHSHTRVAKEQIFNGIMITQAGSKLQYGTLISLTVKNDGTVQPNMTLIDIRNSKNEKASVRAMVDKFNDNPMLNQVIATATAEFTSHEELGYLMADAQREAANADIALVNPGGVRIGRLPGGPVTIRNVYELDPFGNELIVTKLTGKEIHSLMLAAFPIDDRSFVYPSGIRTKVKFGTDGNLKDFEILKENGEPLDMNKTYTVAMNNYMTSVYKYNHSDPGHSLYISTADAMIGYLKKIQNIRDYKGEKRVEVDRDSN